MYSVHGDQPGERVTVVGVDGSPGSITALRWAVAHPEICGRLHPICAWRQPFWVMSPPKVGRALPAIDDSLVEAAEAVLEDALRDIDPERLMPSDVAHGRAGEVLVEAAGHADLLVVGTRGRGAVTDRLLGSTSLHCVMHTTVPLVIIPPETEPDDELERIVVGVDGSAGGLAALRWALEHRGSAEVEAVHVYGAGGPVEPAHLFDGAIEDALGPIAFGDPTPPIEWVVTPGDPRVILPRRQGQLLVVGTRGERRIRHLVLGSVATAVAHHPNHPTVLVPLPNDELGG